MSNRESIQERLGKRMRPAFFEIASDGVLVYLDPFIGPLASRERELAVKLNPDKSQLELQVGNRVESTYHPTEDAIAACRAASGAFFEAVLRLCRP
jgi:hypothetical protein